MVSARRRSDKEGETLPSGSTGATGERGAGGRATITDALDSRTSRDVVPRV